MKAGKVSLRIEVDEQQIATAMIAAGRLCDVDSADRYALEREAGRILAEWCSRWR